MADPSPVTGGGFPLSLDGLPVWAQVAANLGVLLVAIAGGAYGFSKQFFGKGGGIGGKADDKPQALVLESASIADIKPFEKQAAALEALALATATTAAATKENTAELKGIKEVLSSYMEWQQAKEEEDEIEERIARGIREGIERQNRVGTHEDISGNPARVPRSPQRRRAQD